MFIVDFNLMSNDDETCPFLWLQRNGTPVDVATATFLMHVKRIRREQTALQPQAVDREVALALSSDNGLVLGPDEGTTFSLVFPRGALAPGRYAYDLVMASGSVRDVIMRGDITVSRGITEQVS